MLNTILLYLFQMVHLIIIFSITLGPFFIKKPFWLLFIIFIDMIIVTGWHIRGYCFFTDIENVLKPDVKECDEKKSFITSFIKNTLSFIDETHVDTALNCIPLLSTTICILKLYVICNQNRKQ